MKQKEMAAGFLVVCGVIGASILLIPLMTAYYAWALQIVWNWYMPKVLGLPPLSFGGAVGIAIVVRFLTIPSSEFNTQAKGATGYLVGAALAPIFVVFFAWLYLQWWPV